MSDDEKCDRPKTAILGPEGPDGGRVVSVHDENHGTSVRYMHQVKEGQPIPKSAIFIDDDGRYQTYEEFTGLGPPKVATPAYRDGWDRIFGSRPRGEA